jgi:hypothetical protein
MKYPEKGDPHVASALGAAVNAWSATSGVKGLEDTNAHAGQLLLAGRPLSARLHARAELEPGDPPVLVPSFRRKFGTGGPYRWRHWMKPECLVLSRSDYTPAVTEPGLFVTASPMHGPAPASRPLWVHGALALPGSACLDLDSQDRWLASLNVMVVPEANEVPVTGGACAAHTPAAHAVP